MGLADGLEMMAKLADISGWRGIFDFEAPGLTPRERLIRLEYALERACNRNDEPVAQQELGFALEECRTLLQLGSLEGADAEQERVEQRVARVKRVLTHYEGPLTRLNRRYWWVGFTVGLLVLTAYHLLGGLAW